MSFRIKSSHPYVRPNEAFKDDNKNNTLRMIEQTFSLPKDNSQIMQPSKINPQKGLSIKSNIIAQEDFM